MHDGALPELDWNDISKPGCYLMIASGLLARVHPEDLAPDRDDQDHGRGARVVMLSDNPRMSVPSLRAIAHGGNYLVAF